MSKTTEMPTTSAVACDLKLVEAEQSSLSTITAEQLYALVEDVRELPDGYAFRLPHDEDR